MGPWSESCVLLATWLVLDLCVGSKQRHGWGRRHQLLQLTIVALPRLWPSVHNFNSEQKNCLVILSLSGLDLNLNWLLDLNLNRIVWFRVNVRSVELSSTRTPESQTPNQHISIPWTQHRGLSFTGNTCHFNPFWFWFKQRVYSEFKLKIDVNFLPPPLSQGHLGIMEFARFEDLGNFHSFLAADMTWPYYIANNLPGRNSSVQKTESLNFYVENWGQYWTTTLKKHRKRTIARKSSSSFSAVCLALRSFNLVCVSIFVI